MSNQNNKLSSFSPVLGLVFGAGAGLFAATLTSWNTAAAIIVGAALGLIAGSIAYGFTKQPRK